MKKYILCYTYYLFFSGSIHAEYVNESHDENTKIETNAHIHSDFRRKWINNTIPYKFDNSPPARKREAVLSAIQHIESVTNIKFIKINNLNKNQFPDFININSRDGSGCNADIGRKGGAQIFNIGNCSFLSVIHEFVHAIGMFHEHNRSDRDSYITVYWDRIRKDKRQNFQINGTESENIREYDYASITHYANNTFSVSSWPTITTPNGEKIGRRNGLSMGDIYAINYMYPSKSINKKVELYSDYDYEGSKYELKNSSPLLGDFTKKLSSLIIPDEWSVILYQGENYTGNSILLKSSKLRINDNFNNSISSVRVIKSTTQNVGSLYENSYSDSTESFELISLDDSELSAPFPINNETIIPSFQFQ